MLRASPGHHAIIARRGYVVLIALTCAAVGAVLLCLGQSESHADSFEHHALVSEHKIKLRVSDVRPQSHVRIFTDLGLFGKVANIVSSVANKVSSNIAAKVSSLKKVA